LALSNRLQRKDHIVKFKEAASPFPHLTPCNLHAEARILQLLSV